MHNPRYLGVSEAERTAVATDSIVSPRPRASFNEERGGGGRGGGGALTRRTGGVWR